MTGRDPPPLRTPPDLKTVQSQGHNVIIVSLGNAGNTVLLCEVSTNVLVHTSSAPGRNAEEALINTTCFLTRED